MKKWNITKNNEFYITNSADNINDIIGASFKSITFDNMNIGDVIWFKEYRIECADKEKIEDLSNLWRQ